MSASRTLPDQTPRFVVFLSYGLDAEPQPENPERRGPEEVNERMRKFFATTLVALVALTMVLAAVGCGQKTESTTSESAPAMTQPTDSSSMMAESTMTDTSMHH